MAHMNCEYIYITRNGKSVALHRVIMEEHLGRRLRSDEIVHHIDGNKKNNKVENLQLTNRKEHRKLHRKYKEGEVSTMRIWRSTKAKIERLRGLHIASTGKPMSFIDFMCLLAEGKA